IVATKNHLHLIKFTSLELPHYNRHVVDNKAVPFLKSPKRKRASSAIALRLITDSAKYSSGCNGPQLRAVVHSDKVFAAHFMAEVAFIFYQDLATLNRIPFRHAKSPSAG